MALLGVNNVDEVVQKIGELKSKTGAGRSKIARRLEYDKIKEKRQKRQSKMTVFSL